MEKEKGIQFPKGENAEIWKTLNILNFAAEMQFKATQINTKLLWFITIMTAITAINSLDGPSIFYKAMVFMVVGVLGLILSKKYVT